MLNSLKLLRLKKKYNRIKKNHNFNLYKKILLSNIIKGKRYNLDAQVKSAFSSILIRIKKFIMMKKVLLFFFLKLQTFVEFRTIRKRLRKYQMPFIITYSRQFFLALFYFKKILRLDKTRKPFEKKFRKEFSKIIKKQESEVLNLIITNNLLAYKNRASIKYRW